MDKSFAQFADFATALDQCGDVDEVWKEAERLALSNGLPRIGCAHAAIARVGTLEPPAIRSNCGDSRIKGWSTTKLYMRDPSVKRAQRSASSFCWGLDYLNGEKQDPKLRSFYRELSATARSMFVVPLPRVEQGALGIAILGNCMPRHEFDSFIAERRSLLVLAMIYADRRMMQLIGAQTKAEVGLLPREAESLEWIATGSSVEDTATRMDLTTATVCAQLDSAKRKLGAQSLAHAIAIGMRHRLIRP